MAEISVMTISVVLAVIGLIAAFIAMNAADSTLPGDDQKAAQVLTLVAILCFVAAFALTAIFGK